MLLPFRNVLTSSGDSRNCSTWNIESELREFTISSLRELGLTIGDSQAEQFMRLSRSSH